MGGVGWGRVGWGEGTGLFFKLCLVWRVDGRLGHYSFRLVKVIASIVSNLKPKPLHQIFIGSKILSLLC